MTPLPEAIIETHQPSRKQAILFFIFTMALVGFIIAWVFIINKGTLTVSGETPFMIAMGSEKRECTVSPCSVALSPGPYSVTLQKKGFFDYQETAQIRRGKASALAAAFRFVPVVEEVKNTAAISGGASIALLLQPESASKLPGFPKNSSTYEISPAAKNILVTIGKELYVYSVADKSVAKIPLLRDSYPRWLGDDELVYLVSGQALTVFNVTNKNSSILSLFDRPFEARTVIESTSRGEHIIIVEEGEEYLQCYLIHREKKTRQRFDIPLNSTVSNTDHYFIYQTDKDVTIIDLATLKEQKIPAASGAAVIETSPGVLVFASKEQRAEGAHKVGQSINQALEDAQKAATIATTAGEKQSLTKSTRYLTELEVTKNSYRTLATVTVEDGEEISDFTPYPPENVIYFVERSIKTDTPKTENFFRLLLAPQLVRKNS